MAEREPLVGVVILNYGRAGDTVACIESLSRCEEPGIETVIVNNGPGGGLEELPNRFPSLCISIIQNEVNRGFCAGNNQGIRFFLERGVRYILLLNNDTIVRPDFLTEMVSAARHYRDGAVVTSKIYYDHDRTMIWYGGGHIDWIQGLGKHEGFRRRDTGRPDTERRVTYATGCSLLVPAGVFRKAGMLKEELFTYMDDTEFSMRLHRLGVPIIYRPGSVVYHRVGGGTKMADYSPVYLYYITRNRIFVTDNPLYRAYLLGMTLLVSAARIAVSLSTGDRVLRTAQITAVVRGLLDMPRIGCSSYFSYSWPHEP